MKGYEDEYKYWVFKHNVYDSQFYFVTTADLSRLTGFISLYAIREEDKASIEAAGSYAGWRGPHWSPTLALDFDTPESGLAAWKRIEQLGLEAALWKSGGKGYHILVNRPHNPNNQLHLIDKEWVIENFPEADTSLYTPLHMFRLPGTTHDKTGNIKEYLSRSHYSNPLHLPENGTILPQVNKVCEISTESIFLNRAIMGRTIPHKNGNRHNELVRLATALRYAGEEGAFIARWLHHTNLLFEEPTPQEELDKIVAFVEAI